MTEIIYQPVTKDGIPVGRARKLKPLTLRDTPIINTAAVDRQRQGFYRGVGAFLRGEQLPNVFTPEQVQGLMTVRELGSGDSNVAAWLAGASEPVKLFLPETPAEVDGLKRIVALAQEVPALAGVLNEVLAQSWREQGLFPMEQPRITGVKIGGGEVQIVTEKPVRLMDLRSRLNE